MTESRARRSRARRCCARTARRRACRSPSRTRTTTSCAPRTRRWPRCSAARRACTPTASTRRSRCPSDFAARIARNTQLILAEETGVTHVVDPLGGSYYVEALTAVARRRGVEADRRGRGARRHDQGRRVGDAEAAHRGGRGAAPGARRPRRGDDRRRQQVPARRRSRPIDIRDIDNAEVRAPADRAARATCKADARSGARARPRSTRSTEGAAGDGNLLELSIEATPGAGDGRRDLRRDGAGVRSPPRRDPFDLRRVRRRLRGRRGVRTRSARRSTTFAQRGRPPAAHPRRQARPGRPRPRRQGDRDRVRRPRLRRRHRPAVPDARGSGARRDRERRARRRRLEPGRRAQDARAAADRGAARAGRATRSWWSCGGVIPRRTTTSCTTPASPRSSGPGSNIPKAASEILGLLRRRNAA